MNQLTFLVLVLVRHLEGDVPNVHLNGLNAVFASGSVHLAIISAVGLGHGCEGSYYSKTFSVLLTFSAQFVQ